MAQDLVADDEVRRRLGRRYGPAIEPWLDELPARLADLAERRQLRLGPLVRRGTMSVVLRCAARSVAAVLKVSPDRGRIAAEASALAACTSGAAGRPAGALAAEPSRPVLLHGDLTPANVLDGGTQRGLVAIDPAPCWGDPAFDTVDLLFWRADDPVTLTTRAHALAERLGLPPGRALRWCAAFAAMVALEHAEAGRPADARTRMLLDLAGAA